MEITTIETRDLPNLWFQAVSKLFEVGNRFKIDRGYYEGQTRLEYDYFIGHVKFPGTRPLLPDIPAHIGILNHVLPTNLTWIRKLQEYIAGKIGVEAGEMIVESKGLHLYGYAEDLGKMRPMKNDN